MPDEPDEPKGGIDPLPILGKILNHIEAISFAQSDTLYTIVNALMESNTVTKKDKEYILKSFKKYVEKLTIYNEFKKSQPGATGDKDG